jgi:Ca2+-binding EF-hand superfamily protein
LREIIETLDPESEGYVTYPHFLALCAIQLKNKTDDSRTEDVKKAFQLFLPRGGEQIIRIQDLRAVAKVLKEDVSEDLMKAMILEANGGRGINAGVSREEFQEIVKRAGGF